MEASPYAEVEVRQLREECGIDDPGPTDREQDLMAGETSLLAERLVQVPGYIYVDVGSEELDGYLTHVEEFESDAVADADVGAGASRHSVVAQDPTRNTAGFEVGFLFLIQRNGSIEDTELVEQLRSTWLGGEQIEELNLAGVSVDLFENRRPPNSRYIYSWADDDVAGVFDGADPLVHARRP